jgi:hypothetical protein
MSKTPVNQDAAFFPEWLANSQWRDRLSRKATHKALDIPDGDDMNITTGMSGKAVAAIAAACGLGPVGAIVAMGLLNAADSPDPATPVVQPPPAVVAPDPADSEYDVRFYDADGNLIDVPHISNRELE